METTPVIIDTDPGCDDALALMLALASPELDIQLITSTAGNVPIGLTTHNARLIEDFLGTKVPIAKGFSAMSVTEDGYDDYHHGATGLGAFQCDIDVTGDGLLLPETAVQAQVDLLMQAQKKVTIVALGPLTNLAVLLRDYGNEVRSHISRLIIMGGAFGRGNIAPYTEFNIGCDPKAAATVFSSGLPITLLPLEAANMALLTLDDLNELSQLNRVGKAASELMSSPKGQAPEATKPLFDPSTIAYLIHPEFFKTDSYHVEVECEGTYTQGATVIYQGEKREPQMDKPPINVAYSVDAGKFKAWIRETLARWSTHGA